MDIKERFKNAVSVFLNKENTIHSGYGSVSRQFAPRISLINSKSNATAAYNRIALDVASIDIKHVKLDENGRYTGIVKSHLHDCLSLEANLDQTHRSFIQDLVLTMFDEGVVAAVPTYIDKSASNLVIYEMRTGIIKEWYPQKVKVNVYNDITGKREDVIVNKRDCAIIENPLYAVVNDYNTTSKRLSRKLALLDYIDERSGSDRLNLIFQLPYAVKSDLQKKRAEERLQSLEDQLGTNKYGMAYIDATEKFTQLNRPINNTLQDQVEYLTDKLYSELGITSSILNGTADEQTMLNYYNRTIEPIISAICDEMTRKFLTITARSQGQAICYYRNPFKLVPVSQISEICDKFTRNEVLSSNEVRQIIGYMPSNDPAADELRNKNLNQSTEQINNKEIQDNELLRDKT